ncbi:MAG: 30S ribosomal protein S20 [Synechococcaceae cyanobacterium SM2_3_1]|nr:30S ribosomal protein S20 [Synechococcaceae cyanobacterium SM2_3_1]
MPQIKSAIKRVQIAERNRLRNKAIKSTVSTMIKKVMTLAEAYEAKQEGVTLDQVQAAASQAFSRIDKAIKLGTMHTNTGARRKARLARRIQALTASASDVA